MRNENKKPYIIAGIIAGLIFGVFLFVREPEESTFDKIGITLTMIWVFINMFTYRGRTYPKSIRTLKVCYPIFIFLALMFLIGRL